MQKMIFPIAKTAQDATLQANIVDRAVALFHNGYTLITSEEITGIPCPELWGVISPEGVTYRVDGFKGICSCPCFEKNNFCKHYGAVEHQEEQIARLEAEHSFAEYAY